MTAVAHSDPEWLQHLLEDAVAKNWCTSTNCFPCDSRDLRKALGLMDQRGMMLPLSECDASIIVAGLRELRPSQKSTKMSRLFVGFFMSFGGPSAFDLTHNLEVLSPAKF